MGMMLKPAYVKIRVLHKLVVYNIGSIIKK